MLKVFSFLFGAAFIAAGVMGFMPNFISENNLLFGWFEVDSMHNTVHLVSGIIAVLAAFNARYARLYFQIFGVIYGIVAILGFARNGDLYMMHVNMADNYLHIGIAVVALYLGFLYKDKTA